MIGYKLAGISSIFQSFFPQGWLEKIEWASEEEQNESILEKNIAKINQFEQKVLLRLGQSMLSGEYVVKVGIKDQLDDIQNSLSIDLPAESANNYVK